MTDTSSDRPSVTVPCRPVRVDLSRSSLIERWYKAGDPEAVPSPTEPSPDARGHAADLMIEMTRNELPPGEHSVYFGERCHTCRGSQFTLSANEPVQLTRSVKPLPDGTWLVQCHEDWCPQWTGVAPDLPCPHCGAPVDEWELSHVEVYRTPGGGRVEIEPGTAQYFAAGRVLEERIVSAVSPGPCRCVLERRRGHDVDGFLAAAGEARARRHRAEVDAVLAGQADILAAARAAGAGPLVAAYEDAVRRASSNAPGLLQALRVQTTMPCRCAARDGKGD